ncbi:hypothetical protein PsorP6_012822 [Peronosclerospora sorghi]|uniref:Uncharacterized protein n=1 Tax=Peronosclerospora sorghi TaxID=230839 RepID=A0ACC0WFK0_9STRA|nr:hypothetical protein PsorP6_012822 [Peronosclerospora sorghi]
MEALTAASERRKRLEMELLKQQHVEEQDQQECHRSRRNAWRAAIAELQKQQAQILRQIERVAIEDRDAGEEKEDTSPVQEATDQSLRNQRSRLNIPRPVDESGTQYSIGGVVTLEPFTASQQRQVSGMTSSRSEVSFHPAVDVSTAVAQVESRYPRLQYSNTPKALNDVFSLQLKFAETMLKLEKSVQTRDRLLHPGGTSTLPQRRTGTTEHRRPRQKSRSFEGRGSTNSSVVYHESHSSESFSSSAYSVSSRESASHQGESMQLSRATTAETLAPCLSGPTNLPSEETNRIPPGPSHTMSLGNSRNSADDHLAADAQESEIHQTPTTGSNLTTPTTGSDQKSNSSLSKQVRFDGDAYSTPVLARKFTFDGPSIEEDDDEVKDEESGSVLSILGGSSIDSAELNDASFVRAFERFRCELKTSKVHSVTESPSQPPLSRKLFSEESSPKLNERTSASLVLDTFNDNAVASSADGDADVSDPECPVLDGLSLEELQERRRQLCLDIQAESAHLVLNFNGLHSVTPESQTMEQTQHRLQRMRDELKVIDSRLTALT